MQSHKLLINQFFSKTGQTVASTLQFDNDYYAYDLQVNGGGVVNEFNVRAFLNDTRNENIINNFFGYLTANTTISEFREIYYSDNKLASVFNQFYNQTIVSGVTVTTSVINENLVDSVPIIDYEFYHIWNGYSPFKMSGATQDIYGGTMQTYAYPEMDTYTKEESYYLPVFIKRRTEQLSRNIFESCDNSINKSLYNQLTNFTGITIVPPSFLASSTINIPQNFTSLNPNITFIDGATLTNHGVIPFEGGPSGYMCATTVFTNATKVTEKSSRINSILDCFVDLNLETNENANWTFEPLPVSFTSSTYYSEEGKSVLITVGLHYISERGIEEVDVIFSPGPYVNSADYSSSIPPPISLTWSAGQQYKYFTVNLNNDYLEENGETIDMTFQNYANTIPGAISSSKIVFSDKTDLAEVALSGLSLQQNVPITIVGPGNTFFTLSASNVVTLPEGAVYNVDVFLNKPAIGIETIDLNINAGFQNSASTFFDYTVSPIIPSPQNKVTISFSPGQTQATYVFTVNTDSFPEQTEYINLSLSNPQYCNLDLFNSSLTIQILDNFPQSKFVALNIPDFFVGFGYNGYIGAQLRYSPGDNTLAQFNMALRHGTQVRGGHINYTTTPNRTPVNSSYDLFSWGNSLGDLIFYAKNTTPNTAFYGTTIVGSGQTIAIDVYTAITSSGFTVLLPTNTNLNTSTNRYEDAQWEVSFYVRYAENQFALRDFNNTAATGKIVNLGNLNFIGGYSAQTLALLPQNTWVLETNYSGMTTGKNNASYTSSSCPNYSYNGYNWSFNSIDENAKIRGIYFLDNVSKTKYWYANLKKGAFPMTGTCGSFSYNSIYVSQPSWISIPFSGLP